MISALLLLAIAASSVAAAFAILAVRRISRFTEGQASDSSREMVRSEADRLLQFGDAQSRGLREELSNMMRGFQDSAIGLFSELGGGLATQIREFERRMEVGVNCLNERALAQGTKLEEDVARAREDAGTARDTLRHVIESKLDIAATREASTAQASRQEVIAAFQGLSQGVFDTLGQLGAQQKERLDNVTLALSSLTEMQERVQEGLRQAIEQRLDAIRNENSTKLESMRKTVDEKLQATLETRLGESFDRVVEQLERVHKGIGEMQSLAAGVGDLKNVLSNVRVRGTFGEVQLATLLEQLLSPEQYVTNAKVRENSQERVEFAVNYPGATLWVARSFCPSTQSFRRKIMSGYSAPRKRATRPESQKQVRRWRVESAHSPNRLAKNISRPL